MSFRVMFCHVVSCHVLSCSFVQRRVVSRPIVLWFESPTFVFVRSQHFPQILASCFFPENLGAEHSDRQAPKFPEFLGPTTPPSAHKIEPVPTFRFF